MVDKIVRCKKCVTPDSLPSVSLDEDGVCNFCRRFEKLDSKMDANYYDKKKKEFEKITRRVKKLNNVYDCLIPLSGGKDSTYTLYLCSKIYKLKCLCVTFDNGFLSEHARKNIANATREAGADHFYFSANQNKMLDHYGLFLKKCGAFCPVCMRGIQAGVQMINDKFKPPLFITGTGRRVTYMAIHPEIFQGGDLSFFKNVIKDEPWKNDLRSIHYSPFTRQINKLKEQLCRMFGLHPLLLGFYSYYIALYDYIEPAFDQIRDTLEKEMGWESPEGKFEHMDCLLHDIPGYIHNIRFPELTGTTLYNSNLVRLGLMSRDEAMEKEKQVRASLKEPEALEPFLKQIGVTKEEFINSVKDWEKTDKYRNKLDIGIRRFYNRILGKQ
jgi:hypothetical protein